MTTSPMFFESPQVFSVKNAWGPDFGHDWPRGRGGFQSFWEISRYVSSKVQKDRGKSYWSSDEFLFYPNLWGSYKLISGWALNHEFWQFLVVLKCFEYQIPSLRFLTWGSLVIGEEDYQTYEDQTLAGSWWNYLSRQMGMVPLLVMDVTFASVRMDAHPLSFWHIGPMIISGASRNSKPWECVENCVELLGTKFFCLKNMCAMIIIPSWICFLY